MVAQQEFLWDHVGSIELSLHVKVSLCLKGPLYCLYLHIHASLYFSEVGTSKEKLVNNQA